MLDRNQQEFYSQFEDAMLGEQVEAFLRSGMGKYLLERAYEQEKRAVQGLKVVDPFNPAKIIELQAESRNATQAILWLIQQYQAGTQAMKNLDLEEKEGMSHE